jgi:hypothetical protein
MSCSTRNRPCTRCGVVRPFGAINRLRIEMRAPRNNMWTARLCEECTRALVASHGFTRMPDASCTRARPRTAEGG